MAPPLISFSGQRYAVLLAMGAPITLLLGYLFSFNNILFEILNPAALPTRLAAIDYIVQLNIVGHWHPSAQPWRRATCRRNINVQFVYEATRVRALVDYSCCRDNKDYGMVELFSGSCRMTHAFRAFSLIPLMRELCRVARTSFAFDY